MNRQDFLLYKEELMDEIMKYLFRRWMERHYNNIRSMLENDWIGPNQIIESNFKFSIDEGALDMMLSMIKERVGERKPAKPMQTMVKALLGDLQWRRKAS